MYHAIDGASPNAILFERPLKYSGGSTQIDKGKLFFKLFFFFSELHALSITCRRNNHDNLTRLRFHGFVQTVIEQLGNHGDNSIETR